VGEGATRRRKKRLNQQQRDAPPGEDLCALEFPTEVPHGTTGVRKMVGRRGGSRKKHWGARKNSREKRVVGGGRGPLGNGQNTGKPQTNGVLEKSDRTQRMVTCRDHFSRVESDWVKVTY